MVKKRVFVSLFPIGVSLMLILMIALPLSSYSSLAATIERHAPSIINTPEFNATLIITNLIKGEPFALEERLPAGFRVSSWSLTPDTGDVKTRDKNNSFAWAFTPPKKEVVLSYSAVYSGSIPNEKITGMSALDAVYFDKNGPGRSLTPVKLEIASSADNVKKVEEAKPMVKAELNSSNSSASPPADKKSGYKSPISLVYPNFAVFFYGLLAVISLATLILIKVHYHNYKKRYKN